MSDQDKAYEGDVDYAAIADKIGERFLNRGGDNYYDPTSQGREIQDIIRAELVRQRVVR